MAKNKNKPDVTIMNHGSVVMVAPLSPPAKEWVDENVGIESWQFLGSAFAVDPRYVDDLIAGMMDAGLVVN